MKKQYSSPCMKFTINVKKDGKPYAVVFKDYDRKKKRRIIVISDEEIQKQMEASKDFGVYFHLDKDYHDYSETKKADPIIEAPTETIPVHEEETLADAKKYLASVGIKTYPSMNKAKAIEAAKEKNIQLIIKS